MSTCLSTYATEFRLTSMLEKCDESERSKSGGYFRIIAGGWKAVVSAYLPFRKTGVILYTL